LGGRESVGELVVVALPGVQDFIAEAQSTSDVCASSDIYAALADRVVRVLRDAGGDLILPVRDTAGTADVVNPENAEQPGHGLIADSAAGTPNRIVALFPSKAGVAAAERASKAVADTWEGWVRQALGLKAGAAVPATPGFPLVQWACVPEEAAEGYAGQWREAQRLLAARRRIRDFTRAPEQEWQQRKICSLAPKWPAEPKAPAGVPPHERSAVLSVTGWVKRRWRHLSDAPGFPSTASIASAPYRLAVLRRLSDADVAAEVRKLDEARKAVEDVLGPAGREVPVPGLAGLIPASGPGNWFGRSGGPWVYPDQWQPEGLAREAGLKAGKDTGEKIRQVSAAVQSGFTAAGRLRELMRAQGSDPAELTSYLAVAVQDLDSMGRFLSGEATDGAGRRISADKDEHRRVSSELLRVAAEQRDALATEALLSVPVYVGGDDLLAFAPASTALAAARTCHDMIPDTLPYASTAVLFFHYQGSIQVAMREAHGLLEDAKKNVPGKHALAVRYLRRSGASATSIQPWTGPGQDSSADLFGIFARGRALRLSPRLVADLERDATELASLAYVSDRLYRAELARLVRRHAEGGQDNADQAADALDWLGRNERLPVPDRGPHLAARVGVFLRQEAR
jgi:CRISPR-associated protein